MATYRPNVAAIMRRPKNGKILIGQRADFKECWQFPQGGVDKGEDLIGALHREVEEEIGLVSNQYQMVACRTGYRYKFPDGHLKKGLFCGQEQTYFLCDWNGKRKELVLDAHHQEFSDTRWIYPNEFDLKCVPKFKRPVFKRVFKDFFGVKL
ncbi:MAG: NUDIX domain-containing protein [Verrucomicrobiota bacterium]